jgi:hypothetical protein
VCGFLAVSFARDEEQGKVLPKSARVDVGAVGQLSDVPAGVLRAAGTDRACVSVAWDPTTLGWANVVPLLSEAVPFVGSQRRCSRQCMVSLGGRCLHTAPSPLPRKSVSVSVCAWFGGVVPVAALGSVIKSPCDREERALVIELLADTTAPCHGTRPRGLSSHREEQSRVNGGPLCCPITARVVACWASQRRCSSGLAC